MKKIVLLLLTINSLFAFGKTDREYIKERTYVECIAGYKFVIIHSHVLDGGISIVQVYKESTDRQGVPQPIKCNKD